MFVAGRVRSNIADSRVPAVDLSRGEVRPIGDLAFRDTERDGRLTAETLSLPRPVLLLTPDTVPIRRIAFSDVTPTTGDAGEVVLLEGLERI